jgi:hypothetical protein
VAVNEEGEINRETHAEERNHETDEKYEIPT